MSSNFSSGEDRFQKLRFLNRPLLIITDVLVNPIGLDKICSDVSEEAVGLGDSSSLYDVMVNALLLSDPVSVFSEVKSCASDEFGFVKPITSILSNSLFKHSSS